MACIVKSLVLRLTMWRGSERRKGVVFIRELFSSIASRGFCGFRGSSKGVVSKFDLGVLVISVVLVVSSVKKKTNPFLNNPLPALWEAWGIQMCSNASWISKCLTLHSECPYSGLLAIRERCVRYFLDQLVTARAKKSVKSLVVGMEWVSSSLRLCPLLSLIVRLQSLLLGTLSHWTHSMWYVFMLHGCD